MSNQFPNAFVKQYEDNLIMLAQQRGSRLRGLVRNKSVTGKSHHFDRLAPTTAYEVVSRHSDTQYVDSKHSRRQVTMKNWAWADLIDEEDEVRALIRPDSEYAINGAHAMGRAMDDRIIAALTGNAVAVDSSDTNSNVALPSGQIIDEDFNTANSNLIVEKLIEAKRILMANDLDLRSEKLIMIHNASAHSSLLNESQLQSSDFGKPHLVDGMISYYMGFNFVHTERLLGTADGTDTDPVKCVAFAGSGVGFAIAKDLTTRMSELPEKNYATQVHVKAIFGATRIEDEKVVEVQCVQS